MSRGPDVRPAVAEDVTTLEDLRLRAIRALCLDAHGPEEVGAWARPRPPERMAARLDALVVRVAECDGAVLGYGALDLAGARIASLFVDPDVARQGVGRALLDALHREAAARGLGRLLVDSSLNARPFYEQAGYRCLGPATHAFRTGGTVRCWAMERPAPPSSGGENGVPSP